MRKKLVQKIVSATTTFLPLWLRCTTTRVMILASAHQVHLYSSFGQCDRMGIFLRVLETNFGSTAEGKKTLEITWVVVLVHIYLSIYLPIYLSLFVSVNLSIGTLSIYLPINLSTYISIYLPIYLSLSVNLSIDNLSRQTRGSALVLFLKVWPKYLATFWLFWNSLLCWILFGQYWEKIWVLFATTSGHTGFVFTFPSLDLFSARSFWQKKIVVFINYSSVIYCETKLMKRLMSQCNKIIKTTEGAINGTIFIWPF